MTRQSDCPRELWLPSMVHFDTGPQPVMMPVMATCPPTDNPDRERFDTALSRTCAAIGVAVEPAQRALMFAHFQRVVEANRQFNLTRITDPVEAAIKHDADSLTLLATPWVDRTTPMAVLDVGTGAGYPAVPLAILCDSWQITAIDGTNKKARFVADVAAALRLANLHARHARTADLARQCPGAFDLILLRAVGKLAPGLREATPLLRPGGSVVFYKSATIPPAERAEASAVAAKLNLSETDPFALALPAPAGPIARQLIRYVTRCDSMPSASPTP